MNKQETLTIFSKIYLSVLFAEGQLYLVKDFVKKEVKQKLNHSLESVKHTCRIFERGLDNESIMFAEEDQEIIDIFFKLAILSEIKDKKELLLSELNILMGKINE